MNISCHNHLKANAFLLPTFLFSKEPECLWRLSLTCADRRGCSHSWNILSILIENLSSFIPQMSLLDSIGKFRKEKAPPSATANKKIICFQSIWIMDLTSYLWGCWALNKHSGACTNQPLGYYTPNKVNAYWL